MKQILAILTIVLCGLGTTTAQGNNDAVAKDANAFLQAMNNWEFDKMVSYTNPKHFEVQPKHEMKQKFLAQKSGKNMRLKFIDFKIDKFSEVVSFEGEDFILIKYTQDMQVTNLMNMSQKEYDEMVAFYDSIWGKENWSRNENIYTVKSNRKLIANRKDGSKKWTFVQYEPTIQPEKIMVTPKQVRDKLKA